jgi:hypothetical protein
LGADRRTTPSSGSEVAWLGTLDVIEVDWSDIDARLWEISENLHRAELTKLQHDEQVAEWIRLTDRKEILSQAAKELPRGRGQPKGGINAAAKELGVDKDAAYRATKVASLSDEAKYAAVKHDLDDNRSALLAAAKENDPKAQVEKIMERAAKKDKAKPAPSVADDVVGVDAPLIWRILPQEVTTFLEEHRQVHVIGRQPRWVTLATLKAAVLAGKTAGWFVADYNVETGAFLATYCASCAL